MYPVALWFDTALELPIKTSKEVVAAQKTAGVVGRSCEIELTNRVQ